MGLVNSVVILMRLQHNFIILRNVCWIKDKFPLKVVIEALALDDLISTHNFIPIYNLRSVSYII